MSQIISFKNPISKYQKETLLYKNNRVSHSEYIESAAKILENYAFIQYLSPQEKNTLLQHIRIKKYYHNQTIYHQNSACEDINIIIEGALKLGWALPSGKYHTNIFIPSGTIINIVPIVTEKPFLHDHIAQGNTIVANISGSVFMQICQKNAQALYSILKLICVRAQLNREQEFFHSTEPLSIRLAKKLVFLVDYHSYQHQDKILLSLKLSQENLAELLQTTRQNINKELSYLARAHILEIKYNQIYILDYQKLSQVAQCQHLTFDTKFL
ncbi:Crp/Fnr family transcriptional regulator [Acinetobacter ihumii]|uniref:Crp/Fnr family transcriptional regulator n=1 Tax=Acinetobacter ihumii TaxID=2483802 RepID=UPI00102FB584|nr:Crp/Fnr family transcriptional regulator [Acinetobacter ihumii]